MRDPKESNPWPPDPRAVKLTTVLCAEKTRIPVIKYCVIPLSMTKILKTVFNQSLLPTISNCCNCYKHYWNKIVIVNLLLCAFILKGIELSPSNSIKEDREWIIKGTITLQYSGGNNCSAAECRGRSILVTSHSRALQ